MEENIKNFPLRLNTKVNLDKMAYDILSNVKEKGFKSRNDYVIKAVVAYERILQREHEKNGQREAEKYEKMKDELIYSVRQTIADVIPRELERFWDRCETISKPKEKEVMEEVRMPSDDDIDELDSEAQKFLGNLDDLL